MANTRSASQTTTTISLPRSLLMAGRKAAQRLGMDFSRAVRRGLVGVCQEAGVELPPDEEMEAPPPRGKTVSLSDATLPGVSLNETPAPSIPAQAQQNVRYKIKRAKSRRTNT